MQSGGIQIKSAPCENVHFFSSLRGTSLQTCCTVTQVIRPGYVLLLSCVTRSLISLKNVDTSRFVLEKNIIPDLWNLRLKSHTFLNRKLDNYTPVEIDGAEKFKLNMKDANCQTLDCAITLDLMKPNV